MSRHDPIGRLVRAGLLVVLLILAAVAVQAVVRPEPAEAPPVVEAPDSEPSMDLAHLRAQDLEFLAEVLAEGSEEGRISATRALLISGDLRGVPLLFGAAEAEDDLYCAAALEVLRQQTALDAWRALAVAPEVCAVEARLAEVEGQLTEEEIDLLVEDPDGEVRDRARTRLSR